jgi:hypothetical protein
MKMNANDCSLVSLDTNVRVLVSIIPPEIWVGQ